ncbi:MAG TPA: 2-phospho-L-lactate guanylyltransferase [Candidatus Dormibacteraeota bacterium]|nr:2-phospho-L-lactate guanylyltransferase [Candidatus Dormibacteraeota bacterium]
MTTRLIVPHRGLEAAKTRLEPVLDAAERVELARKLLAHVLSVAHEACADVVVITPAASLEPIIAAAGARLVVQRGMGLNQGLDQARGEALADGIETLAILHGDLPNLTAADVAALISAVPVPTGVTIAPDRAGAGTNGLALRPPGAIGFQFGPGSFAAHRSAAEVTGLPIAIVERPGLAFDLDTPEDLARWLELGDAA